MDLNVDVGCNTRRYFSNPGGLLLRKCQGAFGYGDDKNKTPTTDPSKLLTPCLRFMDSVLLTRSNRFGILDLFLPGRANNYEKNFHKRRKAILFKLKSSGYNRSLFLS